MVTLKIKEKRIAKGLSQTEASEALQIDRTLLSRYETGDRVPRLDDLEKMAAFFGCSVRDLIDESPGPEAA